MLLARLWRSREFSATRANIVLWVSTMNLSTSMVKPWLTAIILSKFHALRLIFRMVIFSIKNWIITNSHTSTLRLVWTPTESGSYRKLTKITMMLIKWWSLIIRDKRHWCRTGCISTTFSKPPLIQTKHAIQTWALLSTKWILPRPLLV